jgi:nicotinamidase/pyrazinamidase
MANQALIIVDVQYDFCPGGALPVPDGNEVVPVINRLQAQFELVVATQDWHPPGHGSFASAHPGRRPGEVIDLNGLPQILWPDHCVQDTRGAALLDSLDTRRIATVIRKGMDPAIDSYSGFFDNGRRQATGLAEFLRARNVQDVWVTGLATDYCVMFTALDAAALGFKTRVVRDACRGVNLAPGDVDRSLAEMERAGIAIV